MLEKLEKKREQGFTLIEVVIVLAIAALIILVVLQAVGAANRANRDTTRKTEAGRAVSLFEQFASNNGGIYPASAAAAQNALVAYDTSLGGKYSGTSGSVSPGPAYTSTPAANWGSGNCPSPMLASTYVMIYTQSANNRDYDLAICTENGTISVVHPAL